MQMRAQHTSVNTYVKHLKPLLMSEEYTVHWRFWLG